MDSLVFWLLVGAARGEHERRLEGGWRGHVEDSRPGSVHVESPWLVAALDPASASSVALPLWAAPIPLHPFGPMVVTAPQR